MWFSNDDQEGCSKEQGTEKSFRSNSPPLEGGESLCDFYIEHTDKNEKLKTLQISALSESFQDRLSNVHGDLQSDVFNFLREEKLPNKNFISLFNQDLLCINNFTQTFLQSILSSVDSSDSVVANAWMETLLDVIDLLPKEIIKGEILTLAVNKGQLSQPVSSRLLCCRMLGKICTKFEPYVIMKEVLPIVLSLCQDVNFEVRGFMCKQLDIIAKGIGLESTKSSILPELVELANDEETFVRLAGIETVIQMLPLLDDDTCKQAIVPLVQKFCESCLNSKDSTLPVVSTQLGQLCHGLVNNLTARQKQWFLQFFKDLSKLGLSRPEKRIMCPFNPVPDWLLEVDNKDRYRECRHACAFNFPAMVIFVGPENFEKELHSTFKKLCDDPSQNVRQTIACGFFEVARLLNTKAYLIHLELVHLLQDESIEVLKKLIPSLPDSLKAVCSHLESKADDQNDPENKLVKALTTCEEATSVSSSWRLHADFLSCLSCLPFCISSKFIFTTFVPLLFVKLHTVRPIPCRIAAAYSLLVFLRSTPSLEKRKGIINELIREFCFGKSCHKRMLFIRICELVIALFSKIFFKLYFFKPLLGLSCDAVPNIRLCLCGILPQLKSLIKLPKDSHLLQDLESCVKTLMADDRDRDVLSAVSKAIQELDKIEVTNESLSRRSSACEMDLDEDDLRKEKEERHLLEMEFNSKFVQNSKTLKISPVLENVLNKCGKIPIRKCGTLPKPAKLKDTQGIIAEKTLPSSPQKSLKSIKKELRTSSPDFIPEIPRNLSKSTQAIKNTFESPTQNSSKCIIPTSSSLSSTTHTWPRQKSISSIPKQTIDHCHSPMLLPQHISEQNRGEITAPKLISTSNTSNKKPFNETIVNAACKENTNKYKVPPFGNMKHVNEVTRRIKCMPPASPEIFRKSSTFTNLSSESKIPMSSPKRRSTIKD